MKHLVKTRIAAAAIVLGTLVTGARGFAAGAVRGSPARLADGTYEGRREYAYYGYVKVQAVVHGGKLSDVRLYEDPSDNGRSHSINAEAIPYLIQEAVDLGKHRTKRAAVTEALSEYIRHRRQERILSLFGTIDYYPDYDYKKHRSRP